MDYYQGYDDAMTQARVSRNTGLFGFIGRIIFSLLYAAFIYVPLLMLGYWTANTMSTVYSNDIIIKSGLTVGFAYLFFAFVYFMKGLLIGFRTSKRFAWILICAICVIMTAGSQSLVAQSFLENFFSSRNVSNYLVWSWAGAGVVALVICSHYQFLTNVAPRSIFWSYQLGFNFSKVKAAKNENSLPQKSVSFFENGPMKVTYKK
jgi:hypothetical protein